MKKLKVLDLFSGVGGFSLGLEMTGNFETVAFCESDEGCQKSIKENWPGRTIFKDIKDLQTTHVFAGHDVLNNADASKAVVYNDIDLICGGFPCQDISIAGKKEGINGERSGLWKEFHRIIKEVHPRWVVIENVANLRTQGLARVIKDLWKIGYCCSWDIIPAASIGAHHLRERAWVIATPADSNDNGCWNTFASPKEALRRWTEATSELRDNWSEEKYNAQSRVCRILDGLPEGLDINLRRRKADTPNQKRIKELTGELKRIRAKRIKQLGNAIVPQIAQLIGEVIIAYEKEGE